MSLLDPPKMGFFSKKKNVQLSKPKKQKKIHDKSSWKNDMLEEKNQHKLSPEVVSEGSP